MLFLLSTEQRRLPGAWNANAAYPLSAGSAKARWHRGIETKGRKFQRSAYR